MVKILVRLKLTLLANSLRRSVWRTVGLISGWFTDWVPWWPCWSGWSPCGSARRP